MIHKKVSWTNRYEIIKDNGKYYLIQKYSLRFLILCLISFPLALIYCIFMDLIRFKIDYLNAIKNIPRDLKEYEKREVSLKALKKYYNESN